jgi:adenosylhomocysteine nucleosidase
MNPAIGLVVALNAEARALIGRGQWEQAEGCLFRRSRFTDRIHLIVVRSGMGSKNASAASRWLIGEGVSGLAVSGVSGGLSPDLGPGDLVLADSVIQDDGNPVKEMRQIRSAWVDMAYRSLIERGMPVYRGPIMTVQRPVLSARDKHALYVKSRALAVDMESSAVAAAAGNAGLPFLAFRAVCDAAGRSIPDDFLDFINQEGRVRLFRLFRRLLLKPTLISDLLRMNRDFSTALSGLGRAWHMAIRNVLPSFVPPIGTPVT